MKTAYIVHKESYEVYEVFGPTIGFLTPPSEQDNSYCVIKGIIPSGVSVPIHSHPDDESFYVLSGEVQVLAQQEANSNWKKVRTGDFVHLRGGVKHAWRNLSADPVETLVTTTSRLGRFFQEVGRPVIPGQIIPPSPPSPTELQYFMQAAARYNHWLGTPEENAAIGISLFT